ncbi:hypothetical protein I6F18_21015 [Bradyrhizobium sp. NBAIM32]|uniref:nSTAND1 domain-containing NTPase n=1 Tax=Bradyrhizobium sp. NBAIM32 TaxID=2793809 RepID=UPI001CD7B836|nr:hypothetical protein [Bradyrhizobium sp. NBAIM32]MCA1542444.1 hypothetical protein [Bradyrhizobium sp. NBAIM32]
MPLTPEDAIVDAPYVGLRPYREAERHLLYGRDEDAARLVNKIFSSQLTLLYAASGVGKTSLLRSLVIPMVRSQDADPVYFDTWTVEDPLLALKQICAKDVRELEQRTLNSVVQDGVGADRDIVLILDQFETFLIHHARNLEPLRRDLGELIRSNSDVHVLISLREEFLAGLSGFRTYVPHIYNSTYRLERLQGEAARAAIIKPAESWSKGVSADLVDQLVLDLRAEMAPDTDPQSALQPEGIEAPFLQLVCRRLWFDAEQRRASTLNIELYRAAGGKEAIIRSYIDEVTSGFRGRQASDAANILRFLAPPSGVKNSLSLQDLRALTSLSSDRIRPILDTLTERIVLRARQPVTTHSEVRYELYHDAFTRVLRPWIDRELYLARFKRFVATGCGVILVCGVVAWLGWSQITKNREMVLRDAQQREIAGARDRAQTDDRVAFLRSKGNDAPRYAREVLGSVALYLLDQGAGQHLMRLADLLRRADQDGSISFDHGIDRPAVPVTKELKASGAPITVTVSDQNFGQENSETFVAARQRIRQAWKSSTRALTLKVGLPVSDEIEVQVSSVLGPGEATIRLRKPVGTSSDHSSRLRANSAQIKVNAETASAVLVTNKDQELLRSFIIEQASPSDCLREVPGKQWVYVPRWSLPVWQVRSDERVTLEALIVCSSHEAIRREPSLLLTWPALSALRRLELPPFDPLTTWTDSEFHSFGNALSEKVQSGRFTSLNAVLAEFAERSIDSQPTPTPVNSRLSRNGVSKEWDRSSDGEPLSDLWWESASEELDSYFETSIRHLLSGDVTLRVPEQLAQDKGYLDRLVTALETSRVNRFATTGLVGPNVQVESYSGSRMLINRGLIDAVALDSSTSVQTVDALIDQLAIGSDPSSLTQILWELSSIEPKLFDEEAGQYSALDTAKILKLLLNDGPPEVTRISFRKLDWLVHSLAFWRMVEPNPKDHRQIAKRLAALSAPSSIELGRRIADPDLETTVRAIIRDLEDGRPLHSKWRKLLQSFPAERRGSAAELFIRLYVESRPKLKCGKASTSSLLAAPADKMIELRHSLEVRHLISGDERAKVGWDYLACNMEVLANRSTKNDANEFFSAVLSRDDVSASINDFPQISRFLRAGIASFSRDTDHSAATRTLITRSVGTITSLSKEGTRDVPAQNLQAMRLFCGSYTYISGCWDLLISMAESQVVPPEERYKAAERIVHAATDFWACPDPLLRRAADVLIALRRKELSVIHKRSKEDAPDRFDSEIAAIFYPTYSQPVRTAARSDALACVSAIDRIRREHKDIDLASKPLAASMLGDCLVVGGKLGAARKVVDQAHRAAETFSSELYSTLADVYLEMDDSKGLGAILREADAKFSENVLNSKDPFLYSWVLSRLLSPTEDLNDIKDFIAERPKLRDLAFAKLTLYWRLRLLNRNEEAMALVQEYSSESLLNEALDGFSKGKLIRSEDWSTLLVRALLVGRPRVDELERYLTDPSEVADNPLRLIKPRASWRLADIHFYKALLDVLSVPAERMESTLRGGLQNVLSSKSPISTEYAAAQALLKRPSIVGPLRRADRYH